MPSITWESEDEFSVDGVGYRAMQGGNPARLTILKLRQAIERYAAVVDELRPKTIVELGIYRGGSVALLAQLAEPTKLVAMDIVDGPCDPLERFIDGHGLRGVVVPRYGIDQGVDAQVDQVMQEEFTGPVDLVIDDASHLYDETRRSFNRLFPRIRPGGIFVLEDWSWPHRGIVHPQPMYRGVPSLSVLLCELVLAAGCREEVVAEVTLFRGWSMIRRGPAELDPEEFDLSQLLDGVARTMVDGMSVARTNA